MRRKARAPYSTIDHQRPSKVRSEPRLQHDRLLVEDAGAFGNLSLRTTTANVLPSRSDTNWITDSWTSAAQKTGNGSFKPSTLARENIPRSLLPRTHALAHSTLSIILPPDRWIASTSPRQKTDTIGKRSRYYKPKGTSSRSLPLRPPTSSTTSSGQHRKRACS